jgi:hypothetical protein
LNSCVKNIYLEDDNESIHYSNVELMNMMIIIAEENNEVYNFINQPLYEIFDGLYLRSRQYELDLEEAIREMIRKKKDTFNVYVNLYSELAENYTHYFLVTEKNERKCEKNKPQIKKNGKNKLTIVTEFQLDLNVQFMATISSSLLNYNNEEIFVENFNENSDSSSNSSQSFSTDQSTLYESNSSITLSNPLQSFSTDQTTLYESNLNYSPDSNLKNEVIALNNNDNYDNELYLESCIIILDDSFICSNQNVDDFFHKIKENLI